MDLLVIAVVLGIVEGLTEFLPVSSTGHLILAGKALGFEGEIANSFDIFIQGGAILAVLVLYWKRILGLFWVGGTQPRPAFSGWSGISKIAVCAGPTLLIGALFHKAIKGYLFFPIPVALALIVGGLLMLYMEAKQKEDKVSSLDDLSLRQAAIVGVWQVLALWPGFSRAGATIMGARAQGISRAVSAEFSFLIALPVLGAAVLFDMYKNYHFIPVASLPMFAVGFVVSFIVGFAAMKFFVSFLRRFSLRPFAYYRIVLGVVVLLMVRW